MVFTFSSNPIDKFLVWIENKMLEYTHWRFNSKPQYVRCRICGEVLSSIEKDTPSPEECGWRHIGYEKYGQWICHRCNSHRNFKPYIGLIDVDEEIRWGKNGKCYRNRSMEEMVMERKQIINKIEKGEYLS